MTMPKDWPTSYGWPRPNHWPSPDVKKPMTENDKQADSEQKKWMLNNIHSLIETYYSRSEATTQMWTVAYRDYYPNRIRNVRNGCLAAIATIVTTLLSLNGFIQSTLLQNISFWIVLILPVVAVMVYFATGKLWRKVDEKTDNIMAGLEEWKYKIHLISLYIHSLSMYPEVLSIKQIEDLYALVIFVTLNRLEFLKACKDARSYFIFRNDEDLRGVIDDTEKQMSSKTKEFGNLFTKDNPIFSPVYHLIEPLITEYITKGW